MVDDCAPSFRAKAKCGASSKPQAFIARCSYMTIFGRRLRTLRTNGAMARRSSSKNRWSARVTQRSNALDLEGGVFNKEDPKAIARSLKRSAERSKRRKSSAYRSAMSMLTFYINRAGRNLPARKKKRLEAAKDELRHLYGRD